MNEKSGYDIYRVLKDHRSRDRDKPSVTDEVSVSAASNSLASFSDIPDIFFDQVIIDFRLSRIEILVLMYIYRRVWCRPNLNREHGISQMMSLSEMTKNLRVDLQEVHLALRKLEQLGFLKTIRSGQFFVRRYFQKEYDDLYGQAYDDFDV